MEGLEYKTLSFKVEEIQGDEEFFRFSGLASTSDIDRGDDIIAPGAFSESLKELDPVVLWIHQMKEPIGITKALHTARGIEFAAKLPRKDTLVSGRVIPQIEIGSVRTMSIGFEICVFSFKEIHERRIRIIEKGKLYEISPVPIPMNPNAAIEHFKIFDDLTSKTVTGFKNLPLADRKTKWSKKAAIPRIREHTGSSEKPSRSYRKYFMWFDSANASDFTAYKLPYADWIDGKFKAVPRALIAIKAAVGGARGGLDVPEADKPKILRHAERYLSQLEDAEKSFILSDVEDIETREDLNEFLKETGLFSRKALIKLSSSLPSRRKSEESAIAAAFAEITNEIKTLSEFNDYVWKS